MLMAVLNTPTVDPDPYSFPSSAIIAVTAGRDNAPPMLTIILARNIWVRLLVWTM